MSLFDFLRDAPPYVPLWPDGGSKRINFDKRFNLHTEEGNVGGKRAEHIWIDDVSVPFKLEPWQEEMLLRWYRPWAIGNLLNHKIISFCTAINLLEGEPMSQSDIDQRAHECAYEDAKGLVSAAEVKPYGVPLFFSHFQWSKASGYTFLVTYEHPAYKEVPITVDLCDYSRPSEVAEEANILLLKYFKMPTECPNCGAPMALPLHAERVIEDKTSIVWATFACGYEYCKSDCGPCEIDGCSNRDPVDDALTNVYGWARCLADAINAIEPFQGGRMALSGRVETAKDAAQDLWDALAEFTALFEDERR